MQPGKPVFVWIELLNYYDGDGNVTQPEPDKQTNLRFQLSDSFNYYARMSDVRTNELSKELININLYHTYSLANLANSAFAAPAIVLYAHKAPPLNIRQTDSAVPK